MILEKTEERTKKKKIKYMKIHKYTIINIPIYSAHSSLSLFPTLSHPSYSLSLSLLFFLYIHHHHHYKSYTTYFISSLTLAIFSNYYSQHPSFSFFFSLSPLSYTIQHIPFTHLLSLNIFSFLLSNILLSPLPSTIQQKHTQYTFIYK
jgi:hypothetical protein